MEPLTAPALTSWSEPLDGRWEMGKQVKPSMVYGLLKPVLTVPLVSEFPTAADKMLPVYVTFGFRELEDLDKQQEDVLLDDAQRWLMIFTAYSKSFDMAWNALSEVGEHMDTFAETYPRTPEGQISLIKSRKINPLGQIDGGIYQLQKTFQVTLTP
jgi:hypothetical protein